MRSQHNIPVAESQAHYYEAGEGPCLVFLHGFLGNGTNWANIIEQLMPHYRCIALDLLGFGGSSRPEFNYDIWHQVRFVEEFFQALNISRFSLIGHSFGGWTAAAFGIAHGGNELQNIGLIAPAGIRDDKFVGRYKHLRPLLWKTPFVDWGLSGLGILAKAFRQGEAFQQVKVIRQTLLDQPVAASFLRDRLRPEDAVDTVDQDLHRITVPTVIFAGRKDTTIPLWHCQTYAEGIQDATFHVYDDAEHGLIQTHAVQIAETLRDQFHD